MLKNFNNSKKGLTLIEMLVAISIFSIMAIGAVNLFSSLIKYQKNLLDKAYVLNTLSYSVEYISKSLRMAQKDMTGACITAKKNYALVSVSDIKFVNNNNECQEFFLEGGLIKVRKAGVVQNLTPANVVVESFRFVLSGEGQEDAFQPKVSLSMKAKPANGSIPSLLIQATISQRMLDIAY